MSRSSAVARRLAEQQTSFSALVNDLRRDLFARYLKDGARLLTEVSALLGVERLLALASAAVRCRGTTIKSQRAGMVRAKVTSS